jgi:selenocysteine lyase/cysteine desulfurase
MVSRRGSLTALLAAPFAVVGARTLAETAPLAPLAPPPPAAPARSPRDNFHITGTYLNAAYTHRLPLDAAAAVRVWVANRVDPSARPDRPDAKGLFARLINAQPDEIAAIPSTSYGESFVIGSLGLKDGRGKVVTDILHFDGSLYTYGELGKQGLGVTILPMTAEGRIDMNRLEDAVDGDTRLVAISLVSMVNGFEHDLKQVCAIAHRKGAKVYVDAVQGVGAVPLDVKASGVDFLACSTFKWLMGDFGYGFLYVRADLLPDLKRPEYGYHQPKTLAYHALPGDAPGPVLFEATPENGTAMGLFEVGSLGTAAQVAAAVSLNTILTIGVDEIQRRRQPLIERVRQAFSGRYQPLTPPDSRSGIIAFALPGALQAIQPRLQRARVNIQVYENRFRVSPSIYNTMDDVERLIEVMASAPNG